MIFWGMGKIHFPGGILWGIEGKKEGEIILHINHVFLLN